MRPDEHKKKKNTAYKKKHGIATSSNKQKETVAGKQNVEKRESERGNRHQPTATSHNKRDQAQSHNSGDESSSGSDVLIISKNRPKRPRTYHDSEKIKAAIEAVMSGNISQRQAAKAFRIPQTTLCDKMKGRSPISQLPHTLLTPNEETKLATFLLERISLGLKTTYNNIRHLAKQILLVRDVKATGKDETPTRSWLSGFLTRHPEVTLKSLDDLDDLGEELDMQPAFSHSPIAAADDVKSSLPSIGETVLSSHTQPSTNIEIDNSSCSHQPTVKENATSSITENVWSSVSQMIIEENIPPLPSLPSDGEDNQSLFEMICENIPSSSHCSEIAPSSSILKSKDTSSSFTSKQSQVLRNFGLFLYDELGRNQFISFCSKLTCTSQCQSQHGFDKDFGERFAKFTELASSVLKECVPIVQEEKMKVFVDNSNTGRTGSANFLNNVGKGDKIGPTPSVSVSQKKKSRSFVKRKNCEKETMDNLMVTRVAQTKCKRKSTNQLVKMAKKKRNAKTSESKKTSPEKDKEKDLKELLKGPHNVVSIDCSKNQLDEEIIIKCDKSDIEIETVLKDLNNTGTPDGCKGCGKPGLVGEVWIQCRGCATWWHLSCTNNPAALRYNELSMEELENLVFQCLLCSSSI